MTNVTSHSVSQKQKDCLSTGSQIRDRQREELDNFHVCINGNKWILKNGLFLLLLVFSELYDTLHGSACDIRDVCFATVWWNTSAQICVSLKKSSNQSQCSFTVCCGGWFIGCSCSGDEHKQSQQERCCWTNDLSVALPLSLCPRYSKTFSACKMQFLLCLSKAKPCVFGTFLDRKYALSWKVLNNLLRPDQNLFIYSLSTLSFPTVPSIPIFLLSPYTLRSLSKVSSFYDSLTFCSLVLNTKYGSCWWECN